MNCGIMFFIALLLALSFPIENYANIPPSNSQVLPQSNEAKTEAPEQILCVEVGWQRIKGALIPIKITYDKLKTIQTVTAPSTMWLNGNFPILFKQTLPNPLTPLLKAPHSKISLSISGPVIDKSKHPDLGKRGIPENLKEECEKQARCEVIVENDVICWAVGTQEFLKLKSQAMKYPYLALTFGTGIGSALVIDENTVYGIEMTYIACQYPRLKFLTREQEFYPRFTPHRALGKPFFDWKLGRREFSDEEVEPFLFNYNNRFQAFIEDIVDGLENLMSIKINDILIGGGYSRFIQIPKDYPRSVILLKPQFFTAEGIPPDIIQLLGCWRLSQKNPPNTFLYPSYNEIVKIRKRRAKNYIEYQRNHQYDYITE